MTKAKLIQTEILDLLDKIPEYQLFHVKPLREKIKILMILYNKFNEEKKQLRKLNTSLKKANKKNRRQKVLQRIAHLHTLFNYINSFVDILLEEALEASKKPKDTSSQYRYKARFKFDNLSDLSRIKGFELLTIYGYYNKNTNKAGVVKDHRVSIKYGLDNNIDPAILGHLANCEFLLYTDNIKKSSRCSITYEQLLEEIDNWDKKYCGLD